MKSKMRSELEKMGFDPDDIESKVGALFIDEATIEGIAFKISVKSKDIIMSFGDCEGMDVKN